jgi:hypothetical protein
MTLHDVRDIRLGLRLTWYASLIFEIDAASIIGAALLVLPFGLRRGFRVEGRSVRHSSRRWRGDVRDVSCRLPPHGPTQLAFGVPAYLWLRPL